MAVKRQAVYSKGIVKYQIRQSLEPKIKRPIEESAETVILCYLCYNLQCIKQMETI